ncbi:MAG: hypothetical protein JWM91_2800, partial [Rhodospirillales bacterium]|nr:hypothetical protein [Rhodospirillales bacterium]MDB5395294.1 hypothetical protein [Rhodospirillales bacterium]
MAVARARDRRKSQPLADKKQRVRRAVGLAHRAVL